MRSVMKKATDTNTGWRLRRAAISAAVLVIAHAAVATPSVVDGFGSGGVGESGWKADDVRDSGGNNLIGVDFTHAPASAPVAGDDALIGNQIHWQNLVGTRGGLGGVSLTGTPNAGGKSTLSAIQTTAGGFGEAATVLGEDFAGTYRFKKEVASTPGIGFKIGIQSTAWGTDAGQSQNNFSAVRSGEPVWDLILVYEPSNNGAGAEEDRFFTQEMDYSTGVWNLFGQASNGNWEAIAGENPPGVSSLEARTLEEWAAHEVWGEYLFGDGAVVTNVQYGVGSGNAGSTSVLDYASVSFLNDGGTIYFADAANTVWTAADNTVFTNGANWTDGAPDADTNVIIDSAVSFTPLTTDIDTRSLAVLAEETDLDLGGQLLTLHNGGHLFAADDSTLNLSNGSVVGEVLEAGGEINLSGVNMALTAANSSSPAILVIDSGTLNVGSGTVLDVVSGRTYIGDSDCGCPLLQVADGGIARFGTDTNNPTGDFARVVVGGDAFGQLSLAEGGEIVIGNPDSGDGYGSLRVGLGQNSGGIFAQTGGHLDMSNAGSFAVGQDGAEGIWLMSGGTADLGTERVLFVHVGRGSGSFGAVWIEGDSVINFGLDDPGEAANWGQFRVGSISPDAVGEILQSGNSVVNINGEFFLGSVGTGTYELVGDAELNFLGTPSNTNTGLALGFADGTGTFFQSGGTVNFAADVRLGIADGSVYTLEGGTLNVGGVNGIQGAGLFELGGGTLRVNHADLTSAVEFVAVDGATSTIDTNSWNATFSNGISGDGSIDKVGFGTLTAPSIEVDQLRLVEGGLDVEVLGVPVLLLEGGQVNTDTITLGDASQSTIEDTLLNVSTAINSTSGTLTFGTASFLTGNATVQPTTIFTALSGVSPGNSVGLITFENGVTFEVDSIYSWFLNSNTNVGPGTNFDQIVVTGGDLTFDDGSQVDLNFGVDVDFSDSFWTEDRSFVIALLDSEGALSLGLVDLVGDSGYLPFGSFALSSDDDSVYLDWTAIPEPHTYALIFSLSVFLIVAVRRVRKV